LCPHSRTYPITDPLSVPLDLEVAAQSLQHLLLLLSEPWSATSMKPPQTALGFPHSRYMTTCPQALPVSLPPSGSEYPQNLPRPRPEEHVMDLH
jgi:hypothetical protein